MKKLIVFFLFFISSNIYSQEIKIKLEDDKKVKYFSKKKKKREKRKKRSSRKIINYNATNLWDAIRPILGTGVYLDNGRVIFNTGALFSTSNKYVVWVINGVVIGQYIPLNIDVQEILDVRVLKSAIETERYGFQGSAGVIEITLKR